MTGYSTPSVLENMNFYKNNNFLWLVPDWLIKEKLLVLVQEFREEYGLEPVKSVGHDMIHGLLKIPPTLEGEACVDAVEMALLNKPLNIFRTYATVGAEDIESLLEVYYLCGERLHPVVKRVIKKSGLILK